MYVNDYDSLHIHPGVELIMNSNARFYVRGKLHAVGTEQDSIVFRGVHDRNGGWRSISFENDNSAHNQGMNTTTSLSYVHIANAGNQTTANAALEIRDRYGDVHLNHILITKTGNDGVYIHYMRG